MNKLKSGHLTPAVGSVLTPQHIKRGPRAVQLNNRTTEQTAMPSPLQVQRPVVWMALHEALAGHASSAADGSQMSAP